MKGGSHPQKQRGNQTCFEPKYVSRRIVILFPFQFSLVGICNKEHLSDCVGFQKERGGNQPCHACLFTHSSMALGFSVASSSPGRCPSGGGGVKSLLFSSVCLSPSWGWAQQGKENVGWACPGPTPQSPSLAGSWPDFFFSCCFPFVLLLLSHLIVVKNSEEERHCFGLLPLRLCTGRGRWALPHLTATQKEGGRCYLPTSLKRDREKVQLSQPRTRKNLDPALELGYYGPLIQWLCMTTDWTPFSILLSGLMYMLEEFQGRDH